jgi:hypothetical protein
MPASPGAALGQLLELAGIDPARAGEVAVSGADPVLATGYMMGTAGAAALGAVGLAAADLWCIRGGEAQEIAIDCRRGAAALSTTRYLQIPERPGGMFGNRLSGFHRTRGGGWIQLHCEFPHFRDGVRALLGIGADDGKAPAAVAGWDAADLEHALAARGLPAFMLRDLSAWAAHAQGAAVAALPPLEIIKIGEAPPEPLPPGVRPLSDVRVLDLTRVIAGPMTGRTLAEHGADVLRISSSKLPFLENLVIESGPGKRNAEADLDTHQGQASLERLVAGADVFSQSYRPGALAARGFGPEAVAERRPGIVYVSLSAWGHAGPWAERRGYDSLVQCATGIAHEQGRDAGRDGPMHLPGQALDYLSGYLGAFGAMVALRRRAEEGGSWLVRLSLAQTADWLKSLGRVGFDGGLELTSADLSEYLVHSDTHWGKVTQLGPTLAMSKTPPRWAWPARPLGVDAATWAPPAA